LFGKCGFNCGRCPSYRDNLKSAKNRQQCSDGWAKYQAFRLSPEKLRACKGCQVAPKERLTYGVCALPHIRNCAIKTGVETCAQCSAFPCDAQEDRSDISREKVATRLGAPIPDEDYRRFIEPYEGLTHLKALRAALSPAAIVRAARAPPLEARIVEFPRSLPSSVAQTAGFKELHRLLSKIKGAALGLGRTDTYAQQARIEKRKHHFARLLWIFGRFGELTEGSDAHLSVDSVKYIANRGSEAQLGNWAFVSTVLFKVFPDHGVRLELVPLKARTEKGYLVPSGWLRNKGWVMRLRFDAPAGGESTLKALQIYAHRLDEAHGKGAFRYFSDVDMRVLAKG
jgi:hypothetical protein